MACNGVKKIVLLITCPKHLARSLTLLGLFLVIGLFRATLPSMFILLVNNICSNLCKGFASLELRVRSLIPYHSHFSVLF